MGDIIEFRLPKSKDKWTTVLKNSKAWIKWDQDQILHIVYSKYPVKTYMYRMSSIYNRDTAIVAATLMYAGLRGRRNE